MFTNLQSANLFDRTPLKIQLINDINYVVPENSTDFTEIYSLNEGLMEPMIAIRRSYSVAYIAGRTYNLWWLTGLDFTHLAM